MSVCKLSGESIPLAARLRNGSRRRRRLPWKWMPASWKPLARTLCLAIKAARLSATVSPLGELEFGGPFGVSGWECTGGYQNFAGVSGDPGGITERDTESLLEE